MPGTFAESNPTLVLSTADSRRPPVFSAVEQDVVELFDRFRDRLLRYLLSFPLALPDSEDVIQETFLALFQHLRRGKSRENLCGWLFRVAHNLALKHQRTGRDSKTISGLMTAAENLAIDPAPNPEDQLLAHQRQQRIMAVLRALPDQNRCCLYLRAEGLRYREIAEVLDMSLGSVSVCLERSLAHIARAAER